MSSDEDTPDSDSGLGAPPASEPAEAGAAPAEAGDFEDPSAGKDEQWKAARFVGLYPYHVTPKERCRLPRGLVHALSEAGGDEPYLEMRNHILCLWNGDPKKFLTLEAVTRDVRQDKLALAKDIYLFLNRYGYINAGILPDHPAFNEPGVNNPKKVRILVIGAGMSGVTAARQLKALGHDVVVLEARDRVGGRVNTDTKRFQSPVDLGASIITGLVGNPIGVLTRQLDTKVHSINTDCPLYTPDGSRLDSELDDRMWDTHNKILDEADVLRGKKPTSFKSALRAMDSYDLSRANLLDAWNKVRLSRRDDLTQRELEIMYWHITNLEYGCAADLSELSLQHWDQDDPYGFQGAHLFLKDGYASIVKELAQDIDIRLRHQVTRVQYGSDGGAATVDTLAWDDQGNKTPVTFTADRVLVTVSLGVLKSGSVAFDPPLPIWKQNAIGRLGFGLINKLVLEFAEKDVFWDDTDMFGRVNAEIKDRGNNYMFWNLVKVTGKPILVSIFSGRAAHKFESTPEAALVSEAMSHLRGIYGSDIADPVRTHKTQWKSDPYARGTYSYVKVGASGRDYDTLARSVGSKLFFAGEATCRTHPATVPGAHISGLYAAGLLDDSTRDDKPWYASVSEAAIRDFENEIKGAAAARSSDEPDKFKKGFRFHGARPVLQSLPAGEVEAMRRRQAAAKKMASLQNSIFDDDFDFGSAPPKPSTSTAPAKVAPPVVDMTADEPIGEAKTAKSDFVRPEDLKRVRMDGLMAVADFDDPDEIDDDLDDVGSQPIINLIDLDDAPAPDASRRDKRKRSDERFQERLRKKIKAASATGALRDKAAKKAAAKAAKRAARKAAKKAAKREARRAARSQDASKSKKTEDERTSEFLEEIAEVALTGLDASVLRYVIKKASRKVLAEWNARQGKKVKFEKWLTHEKRRRALEKLMVRYADMAKEKSK